MAQAQTTVDGDLTKTFTEARMSVSAEPVTPSDADVLRLVHGGGVIDEQHDTKAKIGEALETAANGAGGDKPVERSASVPVVTGQAIPGGVAVQAEAAEGARVTAAELDDAMKVFDPAFFMEYFSREDVQRDLDAFLKALGGFR